jgi:hypothetical protein
MPVPQERMSKIAALALTLAVLAGITLRLIFPYDIEYKSDERYMMDRVRHVGVDEPWPTLGMPSSAEVRNPGMSVWVFIALGRIFHATDPVELARAAQLLNILAILGLLAFALRFIPKPDREPWLWAVALVSLNPMAILLHRKIWAQCVTPIFGLVVWIGWWKRNTRWGAALWGLAGAFIGQVHMSGFYFALALVLWTLIFARKSVNWLWWLGASVLGALPLIPWIHHVLTSPAIPKRGWRLEQLPGLKFIGVWLAEALGIDQRWAMGSIDYREFLTSPQIAGYSTYLAGIATALLLIAGAIVLIIALIELTRRKRVDLTDRQSSLALAAAFLGYGLIATIIPFGFSRTYTLVTFPMVYLSLPMILLGWRNASPITHRRILLAAIAVFQFILAATFLWYVHVHGGTPHGQYGTAYGHQH